MRTPRFRVDRAPRSYAEQTYDSPYWVIRFPHRRRYELAISTIARVNATAITDYGAGDGYFITRLLEDPRVAANVTVVAYEPVDPVREALRARLGEHAHGERVTVCSAESEIASDSCDLLTCLGVLEHLTLRDRFSFYDLARHVLRDHGRCLIDVPIEIGASVLIKNVGRRMLKGRPKEYTWQESLVATAGRMVFDPGRFDPGAPRSYIVSHKGFDYRLLRSELERRFVVDTTIRSPLPMLPAGVMNQEIFFLAELRTTRTPKRVPA